MALGIHDTKIVLRGSIASVSELSSEAKGGSVVTSVIRIINTHRHSYPFCTNYGCNAQAGKPRRAWASGHLADGAEPGRPKPGIPFLVQSTVRRQSF